MLGGDGKGTTDRIIHLVIPINTQIDVWAHTVATPSRRSNTHTHTYHMHKHKLIQLYFEQAEMPPRFCCVRTRGNTRKLRARKMEEMFVKILMAYC